MSRDESAPRTETAYRADRLRFAVGYLAKHAKGISLSDWDKISNDILDAAKLLDACHNPERNEDEDNNVCPRDDLRDRVYSHTVAEPGYRPGNGGTLAHASTRLAVVGDNRDSSREPDADGLIRATNLLNRCLSPRGGDLYIGHIGDTGAQDLIADIAAVFRSRDKFVKWIVAYDCAQYEKLLAEAQLTKTPSAGHDAGNLRGLADRLESFLRVLESARGAQNKAISVWADDVVIVASAVNALRLAEPNIHQPHALSQGWPAGCHSPNSCNRHQRCMYVNCKFENTDIREAIAAALPAPPSPDAKTGGAE